MTKVKAKSYTYKVIINKVCVNRLLTHNKRRFSQKLASLPWRELKRKNASVYLKVYYGRLLDSFGKMSSFHNDGEYTTKKDFMQAYRAFTEC